MAARKAMLADIATGHDSAAEALLGLVSLGQERKAPAMKLPPVPPPAAPAHKGGGGAPKVGEVEELVAAYKRGQLSLGADRDVGIGADAGAQQQHALVGFVENLEEDSPYVPCPELVKSLGASLGTQGVPPAPSAIGTMQLPPYPPPPAKRSRAMASSSGKNASLTWEEPVSMAKMAKHLAPTYEALAVIKSNCHDDGDRDELDGICNLPTNTLSSGNAASPPEWNDCSPPRSPSSLVRSHSASPSENATAPPSEDATAPPSSPPRRVDKPAAAASRPPPPASSATAPLATATAPLALSTPAPLASAPIQWEKMIDISSMRTFGGSATKPPARISYLTTGMPGSATKPPAGISYLTTGMPMSQQLLPKGSSNGSQQPLARPTHLLPKSHAGSAEPSRFTWGQLQPGVPSGGRRSRAPPAPAQQNGSVKFDWVKMVPPKKLV